MNSTVAREGLIERLIGTKGIVVRESKSEAPYWDCEGLPRPFDVLVENIAGQRAEELITSIEETLAAEMTGDDKQQLVWDIIMNAISHDPAYKKSIDLIADYLLTSPIPKPHAIAGGEVRDWLFSIPLAAELRVPHVFLLQSGKVWNSNEYGEPIFNSLAGKRVLHMTGSICTGERLVSQWLPMLRELEPGVLHTLAVVLHDTTDMQVLADAGVEAYAPLTVDQQLFEKARRMRLIPLFAYEEIDEYFTSPEQWTEELLQASGQVILDSLPAADETTRDRVRNFVTQNPFGLREEYLELFDQIARRLV